MLKIFLKLNVQVHFPSSPGDKSLRKMSGFWRRRGVVGDEPVLAWLQHIAPWATALLTLWIFSWAEEYSLTPPWRWEPKTYREVQLSLLGQRIVHIHLFLQRTQVKECSGLYSGSGSSSTYSSSQDQIQMKNSWRRIQPGVGSTMVNHHSNILCSKSVGWL